MRSNKIEPTNEETLNLEETNHDDEQEIDEIFRIETNLFDYETPMCEKFKEFNYLLKIDLDILTKDIEGFKTYDEYKDDWIYEWNENVPWVHENPWTDIGWPTCSWKEDGYFNRGNLPGAYIIGNTLRYQDLELYDPLMDSELKKEDLRNKATMEGMINDNDELSNNGWRDRMVMRLQTMIKKKMNMRMNMKMRKYVNCLMIKSCQFTLLEASR
uniref:Uncharacterized protein n=1 Tax=Tanacetum cinerariifolium TaxID=118510 RepID=A0A6L2NJV0_TANCI|nr:hypothetical protein [Tanacetum cinerariifolium]